MLTANKDDISVTAAEMRIKASGLEKTGSASKSIIYAIMKIDLHLL